MENGHTTHTINGTLFAGSTVTYRCNSLYELKGSNTITCQEDRTWSPSVPTCEKYNGNTHFFL